MLRAWSSEPGEHSFELRRAAWRARTIDTYRFYLTARVWYAIGWHCIITINLVYMVQVAELDPLQMVLVGTVLEASVFLFEIPTGVVADLVSRRLSVIIGHAMMGVGLFVMVVHPSFLVILVSQVIWGVGYTFISGAYPAWLSGEIGKERAGHAFLRGAQLGHVGGFVGIALAVALAHVDLRLPIAVGALGIVALALFMWVFMRETGFQRNQEGATWRGMADTFNSGLRTLSAVRVLWLLLIIAAVYGAFSEGMDRLFTPYLIEGFDFPELGALDSVAWWGVLAAVASVVGLISTTLARRYVRLDSESGLAWVLGCLLAGMALVVLLISQLDAFAAVIVAFWSLGALRSAYGPLMTAWLNRRLPEEAKATLFSMYGQADAVGQTLGGPVIGVIARSISISVALAVSAVLLMPCVALYVRTSRRLKGEQA